MGYEMGANRLVQCTANTCTIGGTLLTAVQGTADIPCARCISPIPPLLSPRMRCKARQRVEQEVWLPLPGLPPQTGDSPSTFSLDISYLAESHSDHELTKRLMQESALKAELLSDAPVVPVTAASGAAAQGGGSTGSGGGSGGAGGALASAPQLRARLVFEPRRALAAAAEVAVVWSGGSRWAFKVELAVRGASAW